MRGSTAVFGTEQTAPHHKGSDDPSAISPEAWTPGLDIDHRTMGSILDELPGFEQSDVDVVVRLFENPESPYALPGAVNLARHDCIHILLGRGLLGQDEAFVVGYTMGAVHDRLTRAQLDTFRMVAQTVYPEGYRMSETDLLVFDLAYHYGKQAKRAVSDVALEERLNETVGDLRREVGISRSDLEAIFHVERLLVPDTPVSNRLLLAA